MAHIHILGICGTFMGGVARLARELGHEVTGSDQNVYPPMSTQLNDMGIELMEGYDPAHLQPTPDLVVIGNSLSRGNPAVEYALNHNIPYVSGPDWLKNHVLRDRHVLAVAGTHGKTSTASALAWILECADLAPGFLIGGVPENFTCSARLGESKYFIVEADEYDSAFFDKRSKFVHYHPSTLVLNNLEFDHADIFDGMADIRRQFHHLLRIVPGNGRIIANGGDKEIRKVIDMGCWTPIEHFFAREPENTLASTSHDWFTKPQRPDCASFDIHFRGDHAGTVNWSLIGRHNMSNGLAAVAAAHAVGVPVEKACAALETFQPAKRRLEFLGEFNGITIYEDFAHHPTAIQATLESLQSVQKQNSGQVIAILEPRSNTMKMGVHGDSLKSALNHADVVYFYDPGNLAWDATALIDQDSSAIQVLCDINNIIENIATRAGNGDVVVIMTNGDFGGLPRHLVERLSSGTASTAS